MSGGENKCWELSGKDLGEEGDINCSRSDYKSESEKSIVG